MKNWVMETGIRRPETIRSNSMGKGVHKFEDLEVWKEAMRLVRDLYQELKNCRDFGLRDQIQRSATSIPSNIAEGFERHSNKDFIRFLYIALGSCAELRTQLYIAIDVKIIEKETGDLYLERSRKISAMLSRYIKTRVEKFS